MNQPPSPSTARRNISVLLLAAVLCIVAAMTLSPTPLDQGYESAIDRFLGVLHRNGVPEWFGYTELEFSANVIMFMPLGFLVALALPARLWWVAALGAPALSLAIELFQAGLLSARFATVSDVIANTLGGLLGVLLAVAGRAIVHARDRKVVARALWERDQRGAPAGEPRRAA